MYLNAQSVLDYFESYQAEIPYHMKISSHKTGPKILLVGATHGNETSGAKALCYLHGQILREEKELLCGEIHFLIGNPKAMSQNTRYVDYDLNRIFNQEHLDSYEAKRAQEISKLINNHHGFDVVFDLHTVSKGDYQFMIYNLGQTKAFNLSQQISPIENHLGYLTAQLPGLMIEECARRGALALAMECGNHDDPSSVDVAYQHVLRLLDQLQVTHDLSAQNTFEAAASIQQYQIIHPIVPSEGFQFTRDFKTGDKIYRGEKYATASELDYFAAEDCYIVMPPKQVDPYDYDAGFLCKLQYIPNSDSRFY